MRDDKTRSNRNNHTTVYNRHEYDVTLSIYKKMFRHYGRLTRKGIADMAGISRQAFYKHYANINQAFYQGIDTILDSFKDTLDVRNWKFSSLFPDGNKCIFYGLLVFLSQQSELFDIICNDLDHQELLYRIVEEAYRHLKLNCLPLGTPAPDAESKPGTMCISMLVDAITWWGSETHCDIKQADCCLDRLMKITDLAAHNKLP